MNFRITYNILGGEKGPDATIVGPPKSTVEDCIRVLGLACVVYQIDMGSLRVEVVPERKSFGFLHSIEAMTPEGKQVPIDGWYF